MSGHDQSRVTVDGGLGRRPACCSPDAVGETLPLDMVEHLQRARVSDRGGDDRALDAFLLRVLAGVEPAVGNRFRDHPNAQDVVRDVTQEVLTRIVTNLHSCRATAHRQVWAWIYRIAQHAGTDYLRATARTTAVDCFLREFERATGSASWRRWRETLDETPPASELLVLRYLFESYEDCPEATAELIWHRVIYAATFEEIGALLGTSAAAAKRRWQRAIATIRRSVLRRIGELPANERAAAEEEIGLRAAGSSLIAVEMSEGPTARPATGILRGRTGQA